MARRSTIPWSPCHCFCSLSPSRAAMLADLRWSYSMMLLILRCRASNPRPPHAPLEAPTPTHTSMRLYSVRCGMLGYSLIINLLACEVHTVLKHRGVCLDKRCATVAFRWRLSRCAMLSGLQALELGLYDAALYKASHAADLPYDTLVYRLYGLSHSRKCH